MGKSEQNSTFEHRQSGDLLAKSIVNVRVNTQKNITMVDCVVSNDVLMNRSDGDKGGATRHVHPPKDMVVKEGNNCGDALSFQTVPPVSQLRNDNGIAPQRSPSHGQASENREKTSHEDMCQTSNEDMCPVDELRRPPLKCPVVDGITLHTLPPVKVHLIERITERHATTDTGDTHSSSSSMTGTASRNKKSGKTPDVESNLMEKRTDETKEGSVDGNVVARNDWSGRESMVTSQDDHNVTVDSDAVSMYNTVVKSSSNHVIETQNGEALQTSHSSSDTKSVTTVACRVGVTKSSDTQRPSVSSLAGEIVSTMSDTVDMSLTSDTLHVPQSSVSGNSVNDLVVSDAVNTLPNCVRDTSSTESVKPESVNSDSVNTEHVNNESVSAENVNTESASIETESVHTVSVNTVSVNTVSVSVLKDKYHDNLSQNVSPSSQCDTEDAVSSQVTEAAVPSGTSDTGDVTVTHIIAPICDTTVSLPAVSATCTDVITVVASVNGSVSGTVARSVIPSLSNTASADVTGSVLTPARNIPDEGGNCLTTLTVDQHAPDIIISSSKITKRKHVGSEVVVIKREKLDTSYDKATAGSHGQVNRGQAQVIRSKIEVMTRAVTVNPVRAPQLARHLLQDTGKESLSKPGRPPLKTVTLQVLPPGGQGSAAVSGGAARLAYPAKSAAGSKSDTCVIMAPSVGSISLGGAMPTVPFTAVARPYVLVSSSATSIVQSQFSQAQPKLQTVTIVPASSAPSRGRMRQVSSVMGGVSKALSRPDSVPAYKCPAPPVGLFDGDPPKTFTCSECLDTFWHERSLGQHLNRMSVSIRIHCSSCKTQLLFYNHCALLMHMRSHRPGSLDAFGLHRAKVAPLPQHFMPAIYWSVCSNDLGSPMLSALHTTDNAAVVSRINVTPQPVQHTVHDSVEKSPAPKTLFQCIECHSAYTSQGQLQHHLAMKVGQKLYCCDRCTMVMRNPCRYHAHVRVHMKQRPYVCPECGELILGDHAVFLKHVKWRCLHFTRTVRFTCTHECNIHFESTSSYIDHVVSKHASNYYKCLSCPMAFRADDAFEKHNINVHASTAVNQHIIKCSYCDTVYQRHAELTMHMSNSHQEALWGLMHYVFKCPQCEHVRATKYDLIKHMETTHAFKYMLSMCNMCGEEMAGRLLAAHKSECHPHVLNKNQPFQWQCNQCYQTFLSAAKLLKHQRVHNGNTHGVSLAHKSHDEGKSSDEANCETNCEYTEPTLEFSCSVCSEHFSEHSELTRHLQAKHGIIPQFPCHLCGLTYKNEADTKRHIVDVHDGKKAVALPTFTCWLCSDDDDASRHFKKRRGLVNHLATVHRIPKNNLDLARLSSSLSDSSGAEGATEAISPAALAVKRLKTDIDSKFVCAKCDFSGMDRTTFVEHIAKHRTRDNPWQCHECALCFTARPSLRRHLFMVHRVRDFERYNKEAGVDLDIPLVDMKEEEEDDELMFGTFVRPTLPPPVPSVVSRVVSDNPLECTVCYKQFDDETAKRVHMRTHGMAFIYSRRRATKPVQ